MTAEIRDPRLAALRGDSLHHMAAVEQAVLEVRRLQAQAPTAAELVLSDLATELASLLHRIGTAAGDGQHNEVLTLFIGHGQGGDRPSSSPQEEARA
jgi:hypothetical protein